MSEIQAIQSHASLPKASEELAPQPADLLDDQAEKIFAHLARPEIDYSSTSAFCSSSWKRFKSLWTKSFIFSLIAGQVVSLCITCTSVTTTELTKRNFNIPTTQTWFLYFGLLCIYTPYTMYQYGFMGWCEMVYRRGWAYFILACCDVEGNFLVVKAYEFTTLLSCMLLDAWAIPICILFTWLLMRTRYHWTQLIAILVCIGAMGLLVASDHITGGKDWTPRNMVKGDMFMLAGATLYGFTNALEEFFVRQRPLYEVVGQLGLWGTIINGIQAAGLEHNGIRTASWHAPVIGLLFAYTAAMLILYTVAPLLYRKASAAYFNLSLLSSDFFGLLFGLFLYHYRPYWLYFVAFSIEIIGLIIYFWHATPESQGKVDPRRPSYVRQVKANTTAQDVEAGGPTVDTDSASITK
ncbi:uncharacterized protein EI90DRAFT_2926025 [Cantharellus anzutake]|uniref:uncharacterized protein n=1 Tax=Cantharellus anzutake TaxID=1750568 RepID=UPI0019030F87|nr:uncharacterized protein EI90DRAFT_2926025 [Cantharellus anzutake]KAF8328377.1 hypothetical protein EI90DRAFT_2926025 [Cantharellus anzutake]